MLNWIQSLKWKKIWIESKSKLCLDKLWTVSIINATLNLSLFSVLGILGREGYLDYCMFISTYSHETKKEEEEKEVEEEEEEDDDEKEKDRIKNRENWGKRKYFYIFSFYNFALCVYGRLYFDNLKMTILMIADPVLMGEGLFVVFGEWNRGQMSILPRALSAFPCQEISLCRITVNETSMCCILYGL